MPKSYSVADARANLPTILDDVEAGKEIELTRRGRAVAVVISTEKYASLRKEQPSFADAYRVFLDRHSLAEAGLEADFFSSARARETGRKIRL